MEPGTATAGVSQAVKFWAAIKDAPLWLLSATALALAAFLAVPSFSGAVSQETRTWVAVAAVTFAIFAICRLGSVLLAQFKTRRAGLEERRTFHLTPVDQQGHWGTTRQKDNTIVTQMSMKMTAKNLSGKALHLLTVSLIKPKIRGEILNNMLLIEDRLSGEYGSAHASGKHIPPGAVRSVGITILIRGAPRQKSGKVQALRVVVAVNDAEGNQQRVKLHLRPFDPNATVIKA